MKRNATLGAVLWAGLTAAARMEFARLTVIELLFLLAPLVVVPLGLELCTRTIRGSDLAAAGRVVDWLQFPAALCVAASFWVRPGIASAIFVLPWFCFACITGIGALKRFGSQGFKNLEAVCLISSSLYLIVGCAWLAASRLGITPMGFQEPIVLLTAVHFHFAGFAAPILALAVGSRVQLKSSAAGRAFTVVAAGVLAGPGLLAAGFVIGPHFKLAMALLVACSEVGLAFFMLASVGALRPQLAQVLVTVSAASVLFAMVFAGVWAIGEFPLQPFLHLDEMAKFHGTANAFGFVLCGLAGWTLSIPHATRLEGGPQ